MKRLILALFALSQAGMASASSTGTGYLTQYVIQNGIAFFWHNGTRSTPPACDGGVRFSINVTTPAGQAALAGLLTAFSSHKPITIMGTGACSDWVDTEAMQYFSVTY